MEDGAAGLKAGEYYGDAVTKTAVISMFNCQQLSAILVTRTSWQ